MGLYLADDNPLDYKVGISGEVSLDYMYSPGIYTANGSFDRKVISKQMAQKALRSGGRTQRCLRDLSIYVKL